MKTYKTRLILALLAACSTAQAHHSHASLDKNNVQRHTGIVTKYAFRMPHVFLQVRGPNSAGELVDWNIELLNPPGMIEYGWDKDTFKPGERITWEGPRDRDPERYYSGLMWAEKGDGTRLFSMGSNRKPEATGVVPSTDFTGLWIRDSRVGFSYYPPQDWPYNDTAKQMVAAFSETQNPQLDCEDPGPPKSTSLPYPMKITRPDDRTIVLDYEMRDQRRVFVLDEPVVPGPPSKIGQSRAWMEVDELVVETSNFVADRWGSQTGVDSSEQKHLVERFSLIEGGMTLRIQWTITDPVYFTEPVEVDYYMKQIPDRELVPANCTLEAARLFIEAGYQEREDNQ